MDCQYCWSERLEIASAGNCIICTTPVCTHPSRRPDKRFHGERCRCGCRGMVCDIDMDQHAQTHSSQPDKCFRWTALESSVDSTTRARLVLEAEHPRDQVGATVAVFNRFLNTVDPGSVVLREAVRNLPTAMLRDADNRVVLFANEFFSRSTVERVYLLALRASARIWSGLPQSPLKRFFIRRLILRILTESSLLHIPLVEAAREHFYPDERSKHMDPTGLSASWRLAQLARVAGPRLGPLIENTVIPKRREDVVRWLIENMRVYAYHNEPTMEV